MANRIKTFFLISLTIIMVSCENNVPDNRSSLSAKELFIDWGKEKAISFEDSLSSNVVEKIAEDIGDAKVVVLSEGFHNCEEMLALHDQLIRHLVDKKGFNAVVTESAFPESKNVNDYIHGQAVIVNLWQNSINKMYAGWATGRKPIEWLLKYNQTHENKVDYFGADIGGFYNDWDFPFQQIFQYLDAVDLTFSKKTQQNLAPYLQLMTTNARKNYIAKLTVRQKDDLATTLHELLLAYTAKEAIYISKSSQMDYQWISQCIKSMLMAENYYRNYDNIKNQAVPKYIGLNGREIAMFENVKWVLSRKKDTKIILINHVLHTKTESQYQGDLLRNFTPMGQLLKEHLQDDIYTIGITYGGGQFWNKWQYPAQRFIDTIPPFQNNGIEDVMSAISDKNFYLNWKNAPPKTYNWFKENTSLRENDYSLQIKPAEWDACIYLEKVSPALPFGQTHL